MLNVNRYVRSAVLQRKAYTPGKPAEEVEREYGIHDILKLASNENMLGTSPLGLEAMVRELQTSANTYPESSCHALVERLAPMHGLTPGHLVVANGEDGVITLLGLTFMSPGDEIMFGEITFPAYENSATTMGAKCVPVPLTKGRGLDVDGFISALTPHTKMIFFCNPNNPTAAFTTAADFERLLQAVPETVLVVSDEAYHEFATHPDYPRTIPLLERHPNLIVLRTFSKAYGLAGLRIGYAAAHPDLITAIMKVRDPFPVNRIAQAGALAALDDAEFLQRSVQLVVEGRKQIARELQALGLVCEPGQANFVFVDLGRPAEPVFEAMLRQGVIIRPLGPSGAPNAIRITVGTPAQNERMLAALKQALRQA